MKSNSTTKIHLPAGSSSLIVIKMSCVKKLRPVRKKKTDKKMSCMLYSICYLRQVLFYFCFNFISINDHTQKQFRHQTTEIGHPTSKIRHRTSDIGKRKSDIGHRKSDIRTSDIGHRRSNIVNQTSDIRH